MDWDVYEHNQGVIADNANRKGEMVRGALREGDALLTGLLRCGHGGRKLLPDQAIAALLNRWGKRTAKGHTWTAARVCAFRSDRRIAKGSARNAAR
jgi:hypothetical protein